MAQNPSWLVRTIAIAIITLIIGIASGYFLYPSLNPSGTITITAGVALPSEIKIGALLTLSGRLETFGKNHLTALELAVSEANDYLQKAGIGVTVKLYVEDTQTDPNVALQKLQALAAQGIKFFIGPLSSAEARQLLSYANDNNLLVFSQSSTAVDLAIPNDNLFRMSPNDTAHGVGLAVTMKKVGIEYVVIMHRNDAYGKSIAQAIRDNFVKLGGQASELLSYDPATTEFSAQISTLTQYVQNAINQIGDAKKVAVELIAFEEGADIFRTIVQNPQYDQVLRSVRWFGSEGTVDLPQLVNETSIAKFAADTKFLNFIQAPVSENDITIKVKNNVLQKLGREPDSFTYNVYDVFWLLFWSILTVGYNVNKVKQVLPYVAKGYIGASGPIYFDRNGDRIPIVYTIRAIDNVGGKWAWVDVGKFFFLNQTVILSDKFK